jgi:E3 ubiquitin-protein ligase CHFR
MFSSGWPHIRHGPNESVSKQTMFTQAHHCVYVYRLILSAPCLIGFSPQIPSPREASPEPDTNPSDFVRPCPNCLPGNPYGWRCPVPIVENAWLLEDGTPPGHALCGNCENVLALPSPLTTKCDFCQVSFCGIGVQGRCIASPILSQHLHNLSDVADLIQTSAVYECFNRLVFQIFSVLSH